MSVHTNLHAKSGNCSWKMAELPLDAPETPPFDAPDQKNSHNLLRQFIRSSMQNLESVAQKMAELPLDAPNPPPLSFDDPDYFFSHNLLGQSI